MVWVQSISPRPKVNNFSRDTVPLRRSFFYDAAVYLANGGFEPFFYPDLDPNFQNVIMRSGPDLLLISHTQLLISFKIEK